MNELCQLVMEYGGEIQFHRDHGDYYVLVVRCAGVRQTVTVLDMVDLDGACGDCVRSIQLKLVSLRTKK